MSRPAGVASVEHLGNGLVRELEFEDALPGILAEVDIEEVFGTAAVDPVAGTLTWATGADFDPDVLHGDQPAVAAQQPRLLSEYRL